MSFRARLTLFFVLIVVLPMVSVGFVLFSLIADNESGKADARLAAQTRTAIQLQQDARDAADRVADAIAGDAELARALREGDRAALQQRLQQLLDEQGARRIVIRAGDDTLAAVGNEDAIFPATRSLVDEGGDELARLQVATEDPETYIRMVERVTAVDAVVRQDGELVAATLEGVDPAQLPTEQGSLEIGGDDYSASSFRAPGFGGSTEIAISLVAPKTEESTTVRDSRLLAGLILAGFFILAFTFAALVSRSLQASIASFLEAARRLGGGDFSTKVPTSGRDEFAELGDEFNKMSRQLEERLEDLARERERLQGAMRRIGETFASNLDRKGLLDIVVKTAVEGVGADGGRATVRASVHDSLEQVTSAGSLVGMEQAIQAVEAQVLETGDHGDATVGEVSALSHPLRSDEVPQRISGVVSVARRGRPFAPGERELFHYLAGQAAVSIENVDLHETVERQAVTDELTGLANRRRFEEAMASEVERSRRFGQPVGLVLLDLDDFKSINDSYGHQQGDVVLRAVARVLRDTSREIDEPARYGGEELAVVLPNTDLDGAYNLAERVRAGIEELQLPLVNGLGSVKVTASFGVATLPASAEDAAGLVAAADDALYQAKRTGKNRTMRAEPARPVS